jgi:hypothetical protein
MTGTHLRISQIRYRDANAGDVLQFLRNDSYHEKSGQRN